MQVLEEYYHTRDPLSRRASATKAAGKKPAANPLARKTIQVAGTICSSILKTHMYIRSCTSVNVSKRSVQIAAGWLALDCSWLGEMPCAAQT
jgi:hypothetical protein